ncbi:hypothetical protein [Pseudomonas mosselii]|uniref:hypothetical protein n=1 Tax=Pseudomonas mosselii TaxID=78327 RepID=UPI0026250486|nr:hypothetical protein [Pseudomonas mosselii]MDN4496668.1 hypothetical protein [Pseudomonas mosselii]
MHFRWKRFNLAGQQYFHTKQIEIEGSNPMVNILRIVAVSTLTCALLSGCDQSAPPAQNNAIGRPAATQNTTAEEKSQEALGLALSSPEAAAQIAAKYPEAVAQATLRASEQALAGFKASPESAKVNLAAYAQLATAAASAAPDSKTVQDAASKTREFKDKAERM